jgi:hypothetical protein
MGEFLFVRFILVISVFCLLASPVAAQEVKPDEMFIDTSYHKVNERFQFDSSGVSIIPPAYFIPFVQGDKTGFIHKGAGSTIQVQILDGMVYTLIAGSLTAEEFLKQNATLKEHYTILTNSGQKAEFFIVSFYIKALDKDVEYERMMLLTGDYKRTVWISANYPVMAKQVIFTALKESLLTIEF